MAKLTESNAEGRHLKELLIDKLINDGYGTYAKRLKEFDFWVTDMIHGQYVGTACMVPGTGEIVINPSFLDLNSIRGDENKALDQLSVLVRHELLHFLLMHEKRLIDHLNATDPDAANTYKKMSTHEIANYAMDYDISNEGYDAHDKEVVRLMTLNGQVIGGLIAEDDHPEWGVKSMEDMFDILRKEHEDNMKKQAQQPQTTLNIQEIKHSQEYTDVYNKVMQLYDDPSFSDMQLQDLIDQLQNGQDIKL